MDVIKTDKLTKYYGKAFGMDRLNFGTLYLLQLELAGICFGISAFLRKGSVGVGLGIAAMMYFLNLIANISDVAEFLK